MTPLGLELFAQATLFFLFVLIGATIARPRDLRLLAGFILFMAADGLVLAAVPAWFHARIGHWNWTGKVLSILLSLVVMKVVGLDRREIGLVSPDGRRSWMWTWAGVLAATIFSVLVNYTFRDHVAPTAEALAFQATMPGFDEELAFRGVGFALLMRGYTGPARPWASVMVTTLVFGFIHTSHINQGRLGFDFLPLLYVLPIGLLLAVVRLKSGSLLGPLLAHNLSNTIGQSISGLP